MANLGVRAHDFGKLPLRELARAIEAQGLTCVQLALAKAVADVNSDTGEFNPGLARHVRKTLEQHGISIAVLGCYFNPLDPDKDRLAVMMKRFKEHLRFARDFGCSVVATETGSRNADWSFHPDNRSDAALAEVIDRVGELVSEAEKFGVFVCIEAVHSHVVSTPERMQRVLDAISSPNLQVLFDAVNMLSPENHKQQVQIIDEAWARYGEKIQIIHAKDFTLSGGALRPALIGEGMLSWEALFRHLNTRKSYIDVLLEDTHPETIGRSIANFQELAKWRPVTST
jgi:L-ribulose-5-phosphate 3-epimerase